MLLSDLFEVASLPLIGRQLPRIRGSYGAFIATMRPEHFLALTTTNAEELQWIKSRPFPYDKDTFVDRLGSDKNYGRYEFPFLKVKFPTGKVTGHEGRHRAAMVARSGGKTVPVVIYPYAEDAFEATVRYYDAQDEQQTKRLGPFESEEDAHAAAHAERAKLEAEDLYVGKTRVERLLGQTLKGAPERSSGWEKAAWRIEDFPGQLIGQYNPSVVVRDFRVGLVKGYSHFRR